MTGRGRLVVVEGLPTEAFGDRLAALGARCVGDGVWLVPEECGAASEIEALRREVAAAHGRLLVGDVRAIVP